MQGRLLQGQDQQAYLFQDMHVLSGLIHGYFLFEPTKTDNNLHNVLKQQKHLR